MNANLVLTFIFPSLSMTFAYVAIMRKLRNSAIGAKTAYAVAVSSGNGANGGGSSASARRVRKIKSNLFQLLGII